MFRLQTRLHPRPARVTRMRCAEAMAPMYAMNVPLFPPTPSKSNMFAVQTIYQSCLYTPIFPYECVLLWIHNLFYVIHIALKQIRI